MEFIVLPTEAKRGEWLPPRQRLYRRLEEAESVMDEPGIVVTDTLGEGYIIEADEDGLRRLRAVDASYPTSAIGSIKPYRYRDPLTIGDPTYAKVASAIEIGVPVKDVA